MAIPDRPDPTFYVTPAEAAEAPAETLAYVVSFDREARSPDGLLTVDVDPSSDSYGEVLDRLELGLGDELHHFGWNACSSALCHHGHHDGMERRYLLVPGLRSSRIHVVDTKGDPRHPRLVRTIEAEEIASRTGYSRPHTVHCGPDGIYVSALGSPEGKGPGGVFVIDHDTFEVKERFELDRGPQELAYDFWWHLGYDTAVTSEWGTPEQVESGVLPEVLLAGGYGHRLHLWDLPGRRHKQVIDLGGDQQMVLELRPAHDPTRAYGFVGVVVSLADLSASVWRWSLDGDTWGARKVIEIPAEPAEAEQLPPLLAGFKAVPPIVTDINLSVDDRWLYVSSWATGEISRYDVSDPEHPRRTAAVHLGGIVRRSAHPKAPDRPLAGGPQMVEVSRDGRRVYLTNSLYGAWDDQFYPDGVGSWMVKLDADDSGGLTLDERFLVSSEQRLHQVHLEGGDASSDSYCRS